MDDIKFFSFFLKKLNGAELKRSCTSTGRRSRRNCGRYKIFFIFFEKILVFALLTLNFHGIISV
nr:MAG TPA: hypothetical protein [Caudoviricetes sp.]